MRAEAMKKPSRAGNKPAKVRRRSALKPKGRSAPKAVPSGGSTPAGHETEVTRLTRELQQAHEQQTASADVLRVISRSTFNLQAVLGTLVQSAARLCEADTVGIGRPKGETLHFEATYGFSREHAEYVASHPAGLDRGTVSGRALLERKIVHVLDVLADPEYTYEVSKVGEHRTLLGVPLLREGSPIGVMALGRKAGRPFTDRQIELAETFATQAVIAIENARLLTELRESLEQQTATSEVLQVISSSPGDLEPVFQAMLEKAVRICDAKFGNIYRWDGSAMRLVAAHNTPPAFADARRRSALVSGPKTAMGRRWRPTGWYTLSMLQQMKPTLNATRHTLKPLNLRVYGRFWSSHC
jgi:hypothetical protein